MTTSDQMVWTAESFLNKGFVVLRPPRPHFLHLGLHIFLLEQVCMYPFAFNIYKFKKEWS